MGWKRKIFVRSSFIKYLLVLILIFELHVRSTLEFYFSGSCCCFGIRPNILSRWTWIPFRKHFFIFLRFWANWNILMFFPFSPFLFHFEWPLNDSDFDWFLFLIWQSSKRINEAPGGRHSTEVASALLTQPTRVRIPAFLKFILRCCWG